jgi:LysM repeat protein
MKQYLFLFLAFSSIGAHAQNASYSARAEKYILDHKDWAIAEQQRSGVPAAITLAQGVHETDAGASELATVANNHFGIKCKKEWTGETFAHDDDAPQECFRKYKSGLESYKDHSDYLKNSKRYQSCFALNSTDYAGWARELKKCGYATNPTYAQRLIKIIEDYHLQDYTIAALNPNKSSGLIASTASPVEAAMMIDHKQTAPGEVVPDRDTPSEEREFGKVVKKDGLKGFWAHKGDVLLEYAIQYKVRYAKLLEMNGLPDAPLANDQFIYLEKGGAVDRMIAKDVSAPAQVPASSEAATPVPTTNPAITASTQVESSPVATTPAMTSSTQVESVPTPVDPKDAAATTTTINTNNSTTAQLNITPVKEISPNDAAAAAEARIFGNAAPAAKTAAPVEASNKPAEANAEKPINIANEKAVEEQKPAEPQDEFSRLKARLDKVVYAPSKPSPAPAATTATNAPAPPIEKPIASTAGPAYHVVKAGETAFGISKQYSITMQQLMDMNKLNFGTSIKVGQKLRVK